MSSGPSGSRLRSGIDRHFLPPQAALTGQSGEARDRLLAAGDHAGRTWRRLAGRPRAHRPLLTHYNDALFGRPEAGVDMTFGFGELIAHAARTRDLCAGSIVGSGTVSNRQGTGHGSSIEDGGFGYSCIAELRMIETIRDGAAATAFMAPGDRVRIEMLDSAEASLFGALDQQVVAVAGTGLHGGVAGATGSGSGIAAAGSSTGS